MSAADLHCPAWCVTDHSDYDESARVAGDLIVHEGEVTRLPSTIKLGDGGFDPFTVKQYRQVHPDGRTAQEGYLIADHAVSRETALELLEALVEQLPEHAA